MGNAAGHLPQSAQTLLLHDRLLGLPQVIVCLLQRCVDLCLMPRQRNVFAQLPQELAFAAAEAVCLPASRDEHADVRGEAYLMLRNGTAAAAEFERILDHPGLVLISPVGALARLGLARAYALQGDAARASAAYQGFLTLWKNADPDIPVLPQAKAEYAKLKCRITSKEPPQGSCIG